MVETREQDEYILKTYLGLFAKEANSKEKKKKVDQIEDVLILQNYLDRHSNL